MKKVKLLLTAIQDHAWKLDHDLIKLLLDDGEIKTKFFDEMMVIGFSI